MVDRLYVPDWSNRNERKQLSVDRRRKVEPSDMGSEEIEKMVDRLSRDGEKKATDCNRTGSMRDHARCCEHLRLERLELNVLGDLGDESNGKTPCVITV